MFTQQDLDQFAERGIGLEKVERQMQHLREGFGWLDVVSAANPKKGVKVMTGLETGDSFDAFTKNRLKVTKFVPASGAASRMFKDLYKVLETGEMNDAGFRFTSNIRQFAFYTRDMFFGLEPVKMIEKVLSDKDGGLGYGSKPKGVLLFHSYSDENRTAFEEHLVEGALYARMRDFTVNLVVSVSPEHLEMFRNLFEEVRHKYESRYGVKYNLEFTVQSPSTDTVAVDMDNNPFRREDGSILFRPGGHGALIENLGAIDSDIVVIKNIDNVVKENSIEQTIFWKKLLIGRLVLSRQSTFAAIARLQEAIRPATSSTSPESATTSRHISTTSTASPCRRCPRRSVPSSSCASSTARSASAEWCATRASRAEDRSSCATPTARHRCRYSRACSSILTTSAPPASSPRERTSIRWTWSARSPTTRARSST